MHSGWHHISPEELRKIHQRRAYLKPVGQQGGVYVWRRALSASLVDRNDPSRFVEWLARASEKPVLALPAHSDRFTHFGVALSSGLGLTDNKLKSLETLLSSGAVTPHDVYSVLSQFNLVSPPLYVGKAKNFTQRILDHLDGKTGLEPYLSGVLNISVFDCQVSILPLDTRVCDDISRDSYLELFELLLQSLTVPPSTERRG